MKQLIGFNIISFAITAFIILIMYDGTTKEKIVGIMIEPILMAILSYGVWLMTT